MSEITEHPPVPLLLQEKLKDYPEILADLQESLNRGGRSPGMSKSDLTDEFERATWCLEDGLDHYVSLATREVKSAEANADPEQIAKAKAKEKLMNGARSCVFHCLQELGAFFGR